METERVKFDSIDEYIAAFPEEIRQRLETLRRLIRECAPEARERITWDMPTFSGASNIVHFAACKNHIGLYPGASGIEAFTEEIAQYKSSKGAVQFPNSQPLPLDLIRRIVMYRVAEDAQFAEEKKQKKAKSKKDKET